VEIKKRALKNPALLLSGALVTNFGNSMYVVALFSFLSQEYPRPLFLGLIQGASYVPVVIFSFYAGATADRSYRPWIIGGTDLFRFLSFALSAVLLTGLKNIHPMVILLPMVFFNGIMQAWFTPATVSYALDLNDKGKRGGIDIFSLRTGISHMASLAGQGVGALWYSLWGMAPLLGLGALAFGLSGISEFFLKDRHRPRRLIFPKREKKTKGLIELMGLMRTLEARGAGILLLLGVQGINSMVIINLPFFLTRRLGYHQAFLGYAMASLFGGSIVMGFIMSLSQRLKKLSTARAVVILYGGILLVVSVISPGQRILLLSLLFLGGMSVAFLYLFTLHKSHSLAGQTRGASLQGGFEALNAAVLPFFYMINSVIAGLFPLDSPWIIRCMGGLALALVLWRAKRAPKG